MKKYKLLIRKYSLLRNCYVVYVEIIETNDIYHEIGKIYCNTLADIRRIDYFEVND